LLTRYGDPQRLALKQRVVDSVTSGGEPFAIPVDNDRFARAAVRVALRQLRALEQSSKTLAAWLSVHDRFEPAEFDEPAEASH
jgi:hypothetical protein